MIIAVDFDGTIVEDNYPSIGAERPFATETLRMLIRDRHRLILWSVREGKYLADAINWCRERGVEFYAVNKDYPEEDKEKNNHFSRKIKADYFIDDRNIGGLPDWGQIYHIISEGKTYKQILRESIRPDLDSDKTPRRKRWWKL
jgi:hypothetical protein